MWSPLSLHTSPPPHSGTSYKQATRSHRCKHTTQNDGHLQCEAASLCSSTSATGPHIMRSQLSHHTSRPPHNGTSQNTSHAAAPLQTHDTDCRTSAMLHPRADATASDRHIPPSQHSTPQSTLRLTAPQQPGAICRTPNRDTRAQCLRTCLVQDPTGFFHRPDVRERLTGGPKGQKPTITMLCVPPPGGFEYSKPRRVVFLKRTGRIRG